MSNEKTTTGLCCFAMYEKSQKILLGEVLTFIDALVEQGQRNKSMKDTVKKFFKESDIRYMRSCSEIDKDENGLTWDQTSQDYGN